MKKIICLLALLSLLCFCLTGCVGVALSTLFGTRAVEELPGNIPQKPEDPVMEFNQETLPDVSAETEPPVIEDVEVPTQPKPKMDMSEPIYELYNLTLSDDGMDVIYRVPQINCDTEDARQINEDIAQNFGSRVEDGLQALDEGYSVTCYEIGWELIKEGEHRFALLVHCCYPGDNIYYSVYNFDGFTGEEISNRELLEQKGLEEADFLQLAEEKVLEYFENTKKHMMDMDYGEDYVQECLDYMLSPEQIHPEMRMFIDEEGGLSIITDICSIAGAFAYEKIIRICP